MGKRLAHCKLCHHNDAATLASCKQFVGGSLPVNLSLLFLRERRDVLAGVKRVISSRPSSSTIGAPNGRDQLVIVALLYFLVVQSTIKKVASAWDTEAD